MSCHPAHGNDLKMTFMTSVCCITRYMLPTVSLLNLVHIVFYASVLSFIYTQDLYLLECCTVFMWLNNYCAKTRIVRYQSFKPLYRNDVNNVIENLRGRPSLTLSLIAYTTSSTFLRQLNTYAWHRGLSLCVLELFYLPVIVTFM